VSAVKVPDVKRFDSRLPKKIAGKVQGSVLLMETYGKNIKRPENFQIVF
jgi:hypothetical protein